MDRTLTIYTVLLKELSRFGDGDHSVVLRTEDPRTFLEVHRGGKRNLFTSHVAALMPNVVVKLRTPMSAQIVYAVPPQQGCTVIPHPPTGLHVVDSLADIISLVNHHRAAILREDATLAVWFRDVKTAHADLHKEVNALLAKSDPARAVDGLQDYGAALDFDQFIHNYDSATPMDDKSQHLSAFVPMMRNVLPPLGSFESVESIDSLFSSSLRSNSFETLSSQSPMLTDSPANLMSSSVSRLRIHGSPLSPISSFSPASMAFTFSSPSVSSGSPSDSMLSTPMTIAPSVLSSPDSWLSTPLSDVGSLPIILETPVEEHFMDTAADHLAEPALPDSPHIDHTAAERTVESPGKRKRRSATSPKVDAPRPAPQMAAKASSRVPKQNSPRRSPRAASPKATKAPTPRVTARKVPQARARKTSRVPASVPALFPALEPIRTPGAPKQPLCDLPGRTVRSRRAPPTQTAIFAPRAPAPAARLTSRKVTTAAYRDDESEREYEESDANSGSEYEADRSSDDEGDQHSCDEDDEEYRPTKRSRNGARPTSSVASSQASCRKATSTKITASQKLASKYKPRRRKAPSWGSRKKVQKPAVEERLICKFCFLKCTRQGDTERHEKHHCKLNPNRQQLGCARCGVDFSRYDAMIRHRGSPLRCKENQRKRAEREAKKAREAQEVMYHDDAGVAVGADKQS